MQGVFNWSFDKSHWPHLVVPNDQDDDGTDGSTEKAGDGEEGEMPAQAGASSQATGHVVLPVVSMLTIALSLPNFLLLICNKSL
jgi:hypothetical protein